MTDPKREITDFAMRLKLPETRDAAIAEFKTLYQDTGSIAKTAIALGVSSRTLERWIVKDADLKAVVDQERRWAAVLKPRGR